MPISDKSRIASFVRSAAIPAANPMAPWHDAQNSRASSSGAMRYAVGTWLAGGHVRSLLVREAKGDDSPSRNAISGADRYPAGAPPNEGRSGSLRSRLTRGRCGTFRPPCDRSPGHLLPQERPRRGKPRRLPASVQVSSALADAIERTGQRDDARGEPAGQTEPY